ncbi:MAG: tetratricopeptide repeat protein [Verrucomicrobia bacterium]|nr:tetratricopeptide repeat protein [Verrucomicrobiota bacterium]
MTEDIAQSASKARSFRVLTALLPFFALLLVEGILRLFGYGGYESAISEVGPVTNGTLVVTESAGAASYFFANKHNPGSMNQFAFVTPKPANTVRIVLAGGSAIKGFPQPMGFACSAFLEEMLSDIWLDKDVEVINLGTTAVASFPVMKMLDEMLKYEPDLVVIYTGHNEHFGTYGVTSQHRAGRYPWVLELQRRVYKTAIAQFIVDKFKTRKLPADITLMEGIMGQAVTPPGDPVRDAAARNLEHHVRRMIKACKARKIPAIVCTLPSNERDLAPLGSDYSNDAGADSALVEYRKGRLLYESGDYPEARAAFERAIDLDTMPWRAPSKSINAITRAAQDEGAVLCDVREAFRASSPGGSIGWELMDDHVHPSLKGQAVLARAIVETMTNLTGSLHVTLSDQTDQSDRSDWRAYAERLGDNIYTRYGVAHTLRTLADIPFYRSTNPEAYERFDSLAKELFSKMPSGVLKSVSNWQKKETHAGGKRPITSMAARALMREKKYAEAEKLYITALRSVPEYSSWMLEYVYFMLACRERMNGSLTDEDRHVAQDAITRGNVLLGAGKSRSGMAERYIGRLHQLRGEFAEAIPCLQAAQSKVYEMDRVAVDYALIISYVELGEKEAADDVAKYGIDHSGKYADIYRKLLSQIQSDSIQGGSEE